MKIWGTLHIFLGLKFKSLIRVIMCVSRSNLMIFSLQICISVDTPLEYNVKYLRKDGNKVGDSLDYCNLWVDSLTWPWRALIYPMLSRLLVTSGLIPISYILRLFITFFDIFVVHHPKGFFPHLVPWYLPEHMPMQTEQVFLTIIDPLLDGVCF